MPWSVPACEGSSGKLFRKRHGQWPPGVDVVLVVRQSAKEASFSDLSRAFDGVTRKLQRLFPSGPRESTR
ncbi:hypothetical protein ACN28I_30075 [Archangium gephyra]